MKVGVLAGSETSDASPAERERDSEVARGKLLSSLKILELHSCCLHHSRNALLKAAPAAARCAPGDAAPG